MIPEVVITPNLENFCNCTGMRTKIGRAPMLLYNMNDDLTYYVGKIIKSCPGKTEGELWGWIKKVRAGEITET